MIWECFGVLGEFQVRVDLPKTYIAILIAYVKFMGKNE